MIFTFYSFKGGVGRSMAMATVGYLLAQRGLKVLVIDFDLEAPGLEHYFFDEPEQLARVEQPGTARSGARYKRALTSDRVPARDVQGLARLHRGGDSTNPLAEAPST